MHKQAFLIIAHNEFEMLQRLINALDDESNDIYVHIDARVKTMPLLQTACSHLTVLSNKRIKIIWGHVSQIKCEILLMQTALESGHHYDFFHIISGTHYPLVSRQELAVFFNLYIGQSVLQQMPTCEEEKRMRFGRYHLFMQYFISGPKIIKNVYRFCWRVNLFVQKRLHVVRDYSYIKSKASNWCSLSDETVRTIVAEKEKLVKRFSYTFCADEYFVPSVLAEHMHPVVYTDKLLFLDFVRGNPRFLNEGDYFNIKNSGCVFGRKFTIPQSVTLIEKLKDGKN